MEKQRWLNKYVFDFVKDDCSFNGIIIDVVVYGMIAHWLHNAYSRNPNLTRWFSKTEMYWEKIILIEKTGFELNLRQ